MVNEVGKYIGKGSMASINLPAIFKVLYSHSSEARYGHRASDLKQYE
jgi:hypothetical protein